MSTTEELAVASVVSVVKMTSVVLVGAVAGCFPRENPILHKDALANLSRLLVNIVWPAWAFTSVGSGIRREDLLPALPLLPWCAFGVAMSLLLGFISARLCHIDEELRGAFIVACGFSNSVGLPIMLLVALCEQPVLAELENCKISAEGCIMLYSIMWNMAFFSVGVPMLEGPSVQDDSGKPQAPSVCKPAGESKAEGTEDDINIKAAELHAKVVEPYAVEDVFCRRMLCRICRTLTQPPMIGTFLGLVTILIPPLQGALFDHSGPLRFAGSALETVAEPGVACFTFVMAASLVPSEKLRQQLTMTSWPMPLKAILALLTIRLVFIPAIFFSVWYAVENYLLEQVFSITSATPPLVALVSLIESAAPSANMPVVFLAKMNKHDTATRLSFSYIFMYPVAALTLAGFSTLALKFAVG